MNQARYENRFGAVTLTPVTEYLPIGEIRKEHPAAQANFIDLLLAEKVVAITENRRMQVCVPYPFKDNAYVVLHDSPSTAAICQVTLERFDYEGSPTEYLALSAKMMPGLV